MEVKDWLIGTLRPDGYLMTESGKILLTTLAKGAPQPPEAATLPVVEEDLSKTALVRGCLVGNVLYSAQAVETLPRLSGALIQKLAEKGVVSLTEIKQYLSELEDEQASGTEVLYYHKSENGKKMAKILLNHLVEYLKLPNRGVKPKTVEDRGGPLLRYTKAPCVIAEPFFIDNNSDLVRVQEDLDGLAVVYAKAIDEISQIV
jgi:hypothetical protein